MNPEIKEKEIRHVNLHSEYKKKVSKLKVSVRSQSSK